MVLEDFHHLLAKPGKQAGTNNYCHGMDCVREGSDDLRDLHGAKVAAPGASPLSTILFSDGTLGGGQFLGFEGDRGLDPVPITDSHLVLGELGHFCALVS